MPDKHENKQADAADVLIPPGSGERVQLVAQAAAFVAEHHLNPPLSLEELEELSQEFISAFKLPPQYRKWLMVMINNEVWRDTVAAMMAEPRTSVKFNNVFPDAPNW